MAMNIYLTSVDTKGKLSSSVSPSSDNDLSTKKYVDDNSGGGGGSSESSDSYTLGYATLNASSSGTVSGALTVPAGKTIMAITVDVATGFVHSSGTSYHAGWFVIDGSKLAVTNSSDTLLQPRGAYENYGSVTFSSNYWGAAGVQASAMARLVVGSSDLDIDFKWSNQFNTLTAGSATLKVFYI